MRYLILIFLLIVAFILFFDDDTDSGDLEKENSELQEEVADLKYKVIDAGRDVMEAENRLMELQEQLDKMMHVGPVSVRNPTWEELKRFVKHDETDSCEYELNQFDCEGFAINLRDHATAHGFQCAYVSIGFERGMIGHTLNAFETADYGLVYIDNTEQDAVGYIENNNVYGTIAIDSVRERIVNTRMTPEEFYNPITYTEFTGNIFNYGYYEGYLNRYQFYSDSRNICNEEIDGYNVAVDRYQQGDDKFSSDELNAWENRLDTWVDNLETLLEELGPIRTEEKDVVETVEIYWNKQLKQTDTES